MALIITNFAFFLINNRFQANNTYPCARVTNFYSRCLKTVICPFKSYDDQATGAVSRDQTLKMFIIPAIT